MRGWKSRTLDECATFGSGGTPSKSRTDFWTGTIPWVSAKDLKVFRLHDAEDHVTAEAIDAGSRLAPAGSIFLLVRGMTLHNDVPICVAMRDMAFNQDIKSLMPKGGVDAAFLTYWLLSQKNFGHTPVVMPPAPLLNAYQERAGSLAAKIVANDEQSRTLTTLRETLLPKLLSGELGYSCLGAPL